MTATCSNTFSASRLRCKLIAQRRERTCISREGARLLPSGSVSAKSSRHFSVKQALGIVLVEFNNLHEPCFEICATQRFKGHRELQKLMAHTPTDVLVPTWVAQLIPRPSEIQRAA